MPWEAGFYRPSGWIKLVLVVVIRLDYRNLLEHENYLGFNYRNKLDFHSSQNLKNTWNTSAHFHHFPELQALPSKKTIEDSLFAATSLGKATSQNRIGTTEHGCFQNRGTPKWMVYNEKLIKMDDLGVPLFSETSTRFGSACITSPYELGRRNKQIRAF